MRFKFKDEKVEIEIKGWFVFLIGNITNNPLKEEKIIRSKTVKNKNIMSTHIKVYQNE